MELRWVENDRRREIEKKLQQKRANELINFKQLIIESKRWKKARNLRNYIKQIEMNAVEQNSLSSELKDWLIWANQKADWCDPLIQKEDELLNNINIESL